MPEDEMSPEQRAIQGIEGYLGESLTDQEKEQIYDGVPPYKVLENAATATRTAIPTKKETNQDMQAARIRAIMAAEKLYRRELTPTERATVLIGNGMDPYELHDRTAQTSSGVFLVTPMEPPIASEPTAAPPEKQKGYEARHRRKPQSKTFQIIRRIAQPPGRHTEVHGRRTNKH